MAGAKTVAPKRLLQIVPSGKNTGSKKSQSDFETKTARWYQGILLIPSAQDTKCQNIEHKRNIFFNIIGISSLNTGIKNCLKTGVFLKFSGL